MRDGDNRQDTGLPRDMDRSRGFPDLYLMRHGQTVWNLQGRMQGRLDSPLTALGIRQARRQAETVRRLRLNRPELTCHSSTLGRARQTALIVFGDAAIQWDDRLVEIDVGGFAGRLHEECRGMQAGNREESWLGWYDTAPGGEGLDALEARVRSFLGELRGPALVVTHGITLGMIRAVACGLPRSALENMPLRQGTVDAIRDATCRTLF